MNREKSRKKCVRTNNRLLASCDPLPCNPPPCELTRDAQKISFTYLFFEVAAIREPYYNPANLEKAGTGVKQKEFIRRIGKSRAGTRAAHQRSGGPCGYLFFRAAGLGDPGAGLAAAHREPLPRVLRGGRAAAAARGVSAPRARIESRGDR